MIEDNLKEEIVKECLRIEEDVLYSGKRHYNHSDRCYFWNKVMGVLSVVFASISGLKGAYSGFEGQFFVYMTFLVTVVSGLQAFLNLTDSYLLHKKAGDDYFALKNRVRKFRVIDLISISEDVVQNEFNEIFKERDLLNSKSYPTFSFAYKKAKKNIEGGGADYKVDKGDYI